MMAVSNGQFCMYTITLLILWIIVLTTALKGDYNRIKQKISLPQTNAEDESKYTGICKNLCKLCDCLGFYCGEECICECNEERTDTECIRKIQIRGQSLNIPFEVLIQGPTANKFVRNALQYEQNQQRKVKHSPNKRSTVTVFEPNKESLNARKPSCEKKTAFKDIFKATDGAQKRHKRASGRKNFDWFSNLGSNLLRPVPLGARKPQMEELKKPPTTATTASSVVGNSWIFDSFDNSRNILTPRPLKKRKIPQTSNENKEDSSTEAKSSHANKKLKGNNSADQKTNFKNHEKPKNTKKPNKKKSFSTHETVVENSQENLIGSLYSLFKNNFDKTNDRQHSLESDEKYEEDPSRESPSMEIENDGDDLFVEEDEGSKKSRQEGKTGDPTKSLNDLSTSQKLRPMNLGKGLGALLKPGKLFKQFRQVISP